MQANHWSLSEKNKLLQLLHVYPLNAYKHIAKNFPMKSTEEVKEYIEAQVDHVQNISTYKSIKNAVHRAPLEEWKEMATDMTSYETKDSSENLAKVFNIISSFEDFPTGPGEPDYQIIYKFLTQCLQNQADLESLPPLESAVLLDLLHSLMDVLSRVDSAVQKNVIKWKYQLLDYRGLVRNQEMLMRMASQNDFREFIADLYENSSCKTGQKTSGQSTSKKPTSAPKTNDQSTFKKPTAVTLTQAKELLTYRKPTSTVTLTQVAETKGKLKKTAPKTTLTNAKKTDSKIKQISPNPANLPTQTNCSTSLPSSKQSPIQQDQHSPVNQIHLATTIQSTEVESTTCANLPANAVQSSPTQGSKQPKDPALQTLTKHMSPSMLKCSSKPIYTAQRIETPSDTCPSNQEEAMSVSADQGSIPPAATPSQNLEDTTLNAGSLKRKHKPGKKSAHLFPETPKTEIILVMPPEGAKIVNFSPRVKRPWKKEHIQGKYKTMDQNSELVTNEVQRDYFYEVHHSEPDQFYKQKGRSSKKNKEEAIKAEKIRLHMESKHRQMYEALNDNVKDVNVPLKKPRLFTINPFCLPVKLIDLDV